MKKLVIAFLWLAPIFPCQATIFTVDDDGPADYRKIQDAIDDSWDGDTIFVKPGTYNENIRFNGRAILITSKDPNSTPIVESTVITAAFGYSVNFDFGEGSDSVLTGFTVTGQGIYCYGASPTISKNIIRDCAGRGITGAKNAAPAILRNIIRSNAQQGIYWCGGPIADNVITGNNGGMMYCDGPITGNSISGNFSTVTGDGGGLYLCAGDIIGNVIEGNQAVYRGGGIYRCDGNISGNLVVGNKAGVEGGGLWNCDGQITHNVISGNQSKSGAGLYGCDGPIQNNTMVGNTAQTGGALRYCSGVVRNNIIAFSEASDIGGIYGPCTSSYNCFWKNEAGNFGGGATPGAGDVVIDPLFAVEGHWDTRGTADPNDDVWVDGDCHLKSAAGRWNPDTELWVKDAVTSPCIDGGDPNSDWAEELWPHGKRINVGVYGNTPEASMSLSNDGNVADLNLDALVDYDDLMLLAGRWAYDQVLLREDLDRNGLVDFADYAILMNNWQTKLPPPRPPLPNPMTWAVEPYATSPYSIAMAATTATSTDGSGAEYYFEDAVNPLYNSGWLSFTAGQQARWEDKGLAPLAQYSYRVKARNKSNLLETGWSPVRSATTPSDDKTPPTPNPMKWESEPREIQIGGGPFDFYATMKAVEATDPSDNVKYYFECTTEHGFDSKWQTDRTYTIRVGRAGQQHRFRVKARDLYGNETGWSPEVAATP